MEMDKDGFHSNYDNEFTYYNRHCGPKDVTTTNANDLLISSNYTRHQAANVMLQHGAVAVSDILQHDTAATLRAYLLEKHHQRINGTLGYNEIFWDEISRMSLGIGTRDHPVIAEALEQVGNHEVLQRTLEGILGKDPAILEISTLTSLNGASDQGIHTDSDWFGSSLLYSRSFLDSYTMFVALQDTSKDLGATTVCPGTHFCADQDLEELCLGDNDYAFEISTNGHTGPQGLLKMGDAFLFNQNIWHRGPQNIDPDGKDRFMFILTFASAKDVATDRRRQGLGTYYYQRFNMWGTTYSMLKDASRTMIQPLAGMRALGLIPTRGVTWIHQFCQQFGGGDEFYDDYELNDLLTNVFDYYKIPAFLRSKAETWNEFIPETMALWIQFLTRINAAAVVLYVVMFFLIRILFGAPTRASLFPESMITSLGAVALAFWVLSKYVERTDLARSVATGDVFVRSFPSLEEIQKTMPSIADKYGPTTFPERNDVLVTTRFDAVFLASFNRFVDFHPGNRLWKNMVNDLSVLPDEAVTLAAEHIVRDVQQYKESGLASRFLLQIPETGAWSLLSEADAVDITKRALIDEKDALVGSLSQGLKYLLADARFGSQRGTAMSRLFESVMEPKWRAQLYSKYNNKEGNSQCTLGSSVQKQHDKYGFKIDHVFSNILRKPTKIESTHFHGRPTALERRLSLQDESKKDDEEKDEINVGSKVWVYFGGSEWYEGELVEVLNDEECLVFFFNSGSTDTVHPDDIKEYHQFVEGDRVEVDYHRNAQEYFEGRIVHIRPDGRCSVRFDDGELMEKIGLEYLIKL